MLAKFGPCITISGGLARGGPILAAKISPRSQIRSVHHDQWGDCFWLGGDQFWLPKSVRGDRFLLPKLVRGTIFSQKLVLGDHFGGDGFWCDRPIATSRPSYRRQARYQEATSAVICFHCGKEGHYARGCALKHPSARQGNEQPLP